MLSYFKFIAILLAFTLIGLSLQNNQAFAQKIEANNAKEKKVLLHIAALPEVQKRSREIKRLSKGKTDITLRISADPELEIPYYQVNVNEGAPTYNNYYQFAVDPKTYQVFFYDAVSNRQYSLAEWRKSKMYK